MQLKVILAIATIAAVGGLVFFGVVDGSPPAVLLSLMGVLAVGSVIGAQTMRHVVQRPRWRGAAARGTPGWSELRRELDRSRRAGHTMALVRIARSPRDRWGNRTLDESVAQAASDLLRSCDSAWIDAGALYVLLPESNADGGAVVLDRINRSLALGQAQTSIAAFPEDGYTSEVLLATLHGYSIPGVAFRDDRELERRQRAKQAERAEAPAHKARTRAGTGRPKREAS